MKDPVILSAVRTPIGKFQGALKSIPAIQLGSMVVRAAVERAKLSPEMVDEVIMGNVISSGLGQNPARQAALGGGLTPEVAALTINKVCGSGLKAVGLAAQGILTGDSEIVVAGGMESMSNAPYLLPGARDGYRLGNATIVDSMIHDGLWDAYEHCHMGNTGEIVAEKYRVSRERQDAFALRSHQKAIAAIESGRFANEVLPVPVAQKAAAVLVDTDESPRKDSSLEKLAALKPAFKKDGTVTAGNAPGVNDGAAALVVTSAARAAELKVQPMARIAGQAVSGIEPMLLLMAPVKAVRKLLAKVGWNLADVDLIELNEAFSVQAVAVIEELKLDPERVNVNGGAVALGHPIGASGARILVTLLHEMIRRNARRGIATLCLGGGNAVALAVER
ncbi:MAG TPA: acetyl-CoA C-acetyltransferase [Terriglobia bacterium]|nr:acetyl-CoA C-acetyltransferase [Terriglobia bacterium]